jgi:hypothetical protein
LKLKDVFSMDSRIDIALTATDLKKVGLASKINKITPTKQAELAAEIEVFKQCNSLDELRTAASLVTTEKHVSEISKQNDTIMDLQELKAKHPELYAQAIAAGKTEGSAEERTRIAAWEAWRSIDAEAVDKGIKEGKMITAAEISVFTAKAVSPEFLKKLTANNAPEVKTKEDESKEQTTKEKQIADFTAEVNANLGRKPEAK